ncbi:hypothetical protein EIN_337150 [Entamoeba invadens IP1]|uniref:Uncharacterized protein n=1 Tax=Entamoeba invadens IP1 TaxID=370355 RepID=L7FLC5_ENTIV|nr:hypothetical protein EIN_337150 [Entamoeba invadens IP1]ELP87666.1 hypothetical protein EIN_337150 [Entamoeba invadens IP1]|eukprot:XP_004254437.1 hypothetical protein EIN_337150 [Entamoeba invadens IP1]
MSQHTQKLNNTTSTKNTKAKRNSTNFTILYIHSCVNYLVSQCGYTFVFLNEKRKAEKMYSRYDISLILNDKKDVEFDASRSYTITNKHLVFDANGKPQECPKGCTINRNEQLIILLHYFNNKVMNIFGKEHFKVNSTKKSEIENKLSSEKLDKLPHYDKLNHNYILEEKEIVEMSDGFVGHSIVESGFYNFQKTHKKNGKLIALVIGNINNDEITKKFCVVNNISFVDYYQTLTEQINNKSDTTIVEDKIVYVEEQTTPTESHNESINESNENDLIEKTKEIEIEMTCNETDESLNPTFVYENPPICPIPTSYVESGYIWLPMYPVICGPMYIIPQQQTQLNESCEGQQMEFENVNNERLINDV